MNVEEYKKLVEAKKNNGENIGAAHNEFNRVWAKDRKGKMPYMLKVFLFSFLYVIAIMILMFVFDAISEEYSLLLLLLTVIASIPIFVIFIKKNMSNFTTYILYDGDLHRLLYTKRNLSITSDVLPIQLLGAALAMSGANKAVNNAANAGVNIEKTINEMSNDPNTWRIDRIKELKVHKHGFKAKVLVTVVMTNKTKSKKISVMDDYIDYPLLLDTVKNLK
ncbi:hypothetical protein [Lachnoclostridium phytofermentans]|uniref:Uncharacterized protein n=1 Tax=Lachnoclostridium phytofermentans (strain ATCC 700394 / DSM 18823 / ISDg) TaxID=357809 RepID=A9KNP3_LACP7|nr:hypothetical protein [Lachnoclostridium phytofermentans]ABX41644.1 hypothetical protein Cphy_1266 [Lachnoclostridium phytofermentans ISDg]